jgi:hypothetical protein
LKTYGDLSTESYAGIVDLTSHVNGYYQNYPGIGFVCNMLDTVNSTRFGAGLLISGHDYTTPGDDPITYVPYIAIAIKPAGEAISKPLLIGEDGYVVCETGIKSATMDLTSSSTYNINGVPHEHDLYYLKLTGGTLDGALDMASHKITNLASPTSGADAVNMDYVSGIVNGVIWKDPVLDFATAPPVSPTSGNRYIVNVSATGDFSGHDNAIAVYTTSWAFETPSQGWQVLVEVSGYNYNFNGTSWVKQQGIVSHSTLTNLSADDHLQYVHNSNARTISASHTFSNTNPFVITHNTVIPNLNAQYLNGKLSSEFATNVHYHSLAYLTDFEVTDPEEGQVLTFATFVNKFINADPVGVLTIDSAYEFASALDRDTYFTAHSSELVEGVFIAVGSGFEQYISDEWVDRTAIARGPAGETGADGTEGTAATIAVGSVVTGDAGTYVTITNVGTSSEAIFNFAIPRGDTGSPGTSINMKGSAATTGDFPTTGNTENDGYYCVADEDCYVWSGTAWVNVGSITGPVGPTGATGSTGATGATGSTGRSATIAVGTTTTGNAGTDAAVVNSGTSYDGVFNFTIPKGDLGDTGPTGPRGPSGFDNPYYQEAVEGVVDAPPEVYDVGDRFIVSGNPTETAWLSYANCIATWMETEGVTNWYFDEPIPGWVAYDLADKIHRVWNSAAWVRWESATGVAYSPHDKDYELPDDPEIGDIIEVRGTGTIWTVTAQSDQYIRLNASESASGGILTCNTGWEKVALMYYGEIDSHKTWYASDASGQLYFEVA